MRQLWQLWESSLSKNQCDNLIEICKQYPVHPASVFSGDTEEVRRSQVRWIQNNAFVKNLLLGYGYSANRNVFGYDLVDGYAFQFTEYNADDQGFYDWHHDIDWSSDSMQDRKLSIVIQLSDPADYEGGDFSFKEVENPSFKSQGSVLVFPSYLSHQVSAVTKGTRYSLVTWIEGPRWR